MPILRFFSRLSVVLCNIRVFIFLPALFLITLVPVMSLAASVILDATQVDATQVDATNADATQDSLAPQVYNFTLPNGLEVFVKPNHRAPVAIVSLWYKVGSSDEKSGYTGVSHVLEHLMFQGTAKHPGNSFADKVGGAGGQFNAWTSQDHTMYYARVPVDQVPAVLQLEADRMQNLKLSDDVLTREKKVVEEEWRLRMGDNPRARAQAQFNSTIHVRNPYHHPVIGWLDDLQQLSFDDIKNWYKTYYVPNNVDLVIVGDVTKKQVNSWVNKYFSELKKKQLPKNKSMLDPQVVSSRNINLNLAAKRPWLIMGFKMPNYANFKNKQQAYASMVLTAILSDGTMGRLPKALMRDQRMVSEVSADYYPFSRYNDSFVIDATPLPGVTLHEIRNSIWKQLNSLQQNLVDEKDIKRIQKQVIANHVYSQDSLMSQAIMIGRLVSAGYSWKLADQMVQRIESVTPKQVQAAAKTIFKPKRTTVLLLRPENNRENNKGKNK